MGDWSSSAPPPGAMLRRVFRPTPRRLRACRTRFWKRAVRTAGPSIPGGHETQGSSTPCRLPTGSKIKSKIISWHKPKPSTDPRGAAIRSCHRRREVYMRVSFLIGALIVAMLCAGQGPANARGNGAWCARTNTGAGRAQDNCGFKSVEACRRWVISGNRGFCTPNPAFKKRRSSER
jgi:hypothetical protein